MCTGAIKREIEALREAVLHHEYLYYILQKPMLLDRDYDVLKIRLKQMEDMHPECYSRTSPTRRYENLEEPEFNEVEHVRPLLKFKSGTDPGVLLEFERDLRKSSRTPKRHFVIEPKIRGVDIELIYEQGEFSRAVLVRDGFSGIDVTQNVRALKHTPLRLRQEHIPAPEVLAIHAILYITDEEFYEYNFQHADGGDHPFFSHESLIEHALLHHDTWITTKVPLKMLCLDVIEGDRTLNMVTYLEIRDALTKWGFLINQVITEPRPRTKLAQTFRDNLLRLDFELPYVADGVVAKVVELSVRDEMGLGVKTLLWGAELLYPPIEKAAEVHEIVYSVDQRGVIVARARFDEIYLKGVEVEQAEFKRVEDVVEWDVRPGDIIRLERDRHERTYVASRRNRRWDPTREIRPRPPQPVACPACGEKLEHARGVLRCTNTFKCQAQFAMRAMYFVGKDGFNIKHLGPGRIQELFERGVIADIADLFTLKWQDFIVLPRVREKFARIIVQEIRKSKKIKLRDFLFALHIPEVGHVIAAELERVFYTLHGIQSASIQALLRLRAVGPMAAQSIYLYFKNPENLAFIEKLLVNGVRPYNPNLTARRRPLFQGKRVLLVGSLRKYRRSEARELIEAEGGTVITNYRLRSDLVIHGKGVEDKVYVQQELGALVWGEAQFLRYLQEKGVG